MNNLHYDIMCLIEQLDTKKILSTKSRYWMSKQLENFVHASVTKFIKGQREHGGDLLDRDPIIDLHQEIIDSFWYISAALQKRK